ncbi:MAG TPA: hypothetical protein VGJ95_14040 [Pseudonocardiaceae bacterium]|jgi:hypothetical protein
MKIVVEGKPYEWDEAELTIADFRTIKQSCGMTPKAFAMALDEGDPDALAALVFLAKRKAGEQVNYADLGTLRIAKIGAMSDEGTSPPQARPDPTVTWPDGTNSSPE